MTLTRKERRRIQRALDEGLPLTRARSETRHAGNVPRLWLTNGEVARALKVGRSSTHRWTAKGELPATREGTGHWHIEPQALETYLWKRARRRA